MHLLIIPTLALPAGFEGFSRRRFQLQFDMIQRTNEIIGKLAAAQKYRKLADDEIRFIETQLIREDELGDAAWSGIDRLVSHSRVERFELEYIKSRTGARSLLEDLRQQVLEFQGLVAQVEDWAKENSVEHQEKATAFVAEANGVSALIANWAQDKLSGLDKEPEGKHGQSESISPKVSEFREKLAKFCAKSCTDINAVAEALRF